MIKKKTYVVVTTGGIDTSLEVVDREVLLARLNDKYYSGPFLDNIPDSDGGDTNYWPDGAVLILKGGEIVVPRAKRTIVEYSVD